MKRIIMAIVMGSLLCASISAQEKAGKKDTAQHTVMYTCPKHSDVVSNEPGKCPKCGMDLNLSPKEVMKMEVTKSYSCPVHKDVTSHDPGKCPQCGRKIKSLSKGTNESRGNKDIYLSYASGCFAR